ncbi:MAG: hypothetical protein Q9201_006463 [Fulgogasparrea decipioides]
MASSITVDPPVSKSSTPRPFLSLPDVIRERICYFVLTPDLDPNHSCITPLPRHRQVPRNLPPLPMLEPNYDLQHPSKSVRKKQRRRIRAYERIKEAAYAAARAAAPDTCLAVLATCRTILLEAFHIFYKHNTFNFTRAEDLTEFLSSIGRVRANEIRTVRLDLPGQDWADIKAQFALSRLLRLEKLIFVYNSLTSPYLTKPEHISYPEIISHLRGLRDVTFIDPEKPEIDWYGLRPGMTPPVRLRMDELRLKMMAARKKPRQMPPMMDLFGRLRAKDQSKKDIERWKWDEGLSYAPEIDGGEQRASKEENPALDVLISSQGKA